jgi:hypothetical protein
LEKNLIKKFEEHLFWYFGIYLVVPQPVAMLDKPGYDELSDGIQAGTM